MKKEALKNYTYYKGESENPFFADKDKAFWWRVESYAFERNDEKEKGKLSSTMWHFLREHVYECNVHDTTYETFTKRVNTMYQKGLWSARYANDNKMDFFDLLAQKVKSNLL